MSLVIVFLNFSYKFLNMYYILYYNISFVIEISILQTIFPK